MLGIDETIVTYTEDEKTDFQKYNGERMTDNELIAYLRKCNNELATKDRIYRKKYEDIKYYNYDIQGQCDQKIKRIREFHRDLIYYSNNRSALMLKAAKKKS